MARRGELIGPLGAVPLFSRCSKRALSTIARHIEVVELADGTELMAEGGAGDAVFVLLAGDAVVERGGVAVGAAHVGDHFGELALLDGQPRSATVRADGPVTVAVLGVRMFRTLLREYPEMAEQVMAGLAAELRAARSQGD